MTRRAKIHGLPPGSLKSLDVDVVIPACDAEATIAALVRSVPSRLARSVIVVDAGSKDRTARVAEDAGAVVVRESRRGVGAAVLRSIAHLSSLPKPPDVVVYLPGDGTADPAEIPTLVDPCKESLFDLVIGSRALSGGPMGARYRARALIATGLIRAIYGHAYSDLGPFRAIRFPALVALGLRDPGPGWLVEMQVKALRRQLRIAEVPVSVRAASAKTPLRARMADTMRAGTRALFQIVRHSTAR